MQKAAKLSLFAGIVLVVFSPVVGLSLTVLSVIRSFQSLGQSGIGDPAVLSGQMGNALVASMAGIVFSVVGCFVVVASALALIILNKRRRNSIPPIAPAPGSLG